MCPDLLENYTTSRPPWGQATVGFSGSAGGFFRLAQRFEAAFEETNSDDFRL
jgi:hypothetical protein